ncbi:cupin domain-containing protein [Paraburkholderia sediminicola]|jgi:quercetin dioxygenase-like cupin family protein|uniref:cupin domain-containing protein n=1 Tax=Paraburkholderia sediminicola TaxID=458836 RepID=UPI0038BD44BC
MSIPLIHRFHPDSMCLGESHGGLGILLSERVASCAPGSAIRHIDLVVLEPGATIAAHTHDTDNEEIYIIVKGRGLMQIEDAHTPVEAGDLIHNPPGGRHGFANDGQQTTWLVVIELSFTAHPAATRT